VSERKTAEALIDMIAPYGELRGQRHDLPRLVLQGMIKEYAAHPIGTKVAKLT
jgi:hypothetical protein